MRRDPKELAKLFIGRCSAHVNGYVGSSFLSGIEYPDMIKVKACVLASEIVHDLISNSEGEEKEYHKEVLNNL